MALTANQIVRVRAALHRAYSQQQRGTPWTKPDVDAVIADADTWLLDNQSNYNVSLSQPFRNNATAEDKALLLIVVAIAQRLVASPGHVDILRQVLAELREIQGA